MQLQFELHKLQLREAYLLQELILVQKSVHEIYEYTNLDTKQKQSQCNVIEHMDTLKGKRGNQTQRQLAEMPHFNSQEKVIIHFMIYKKASTNNPNTKTSTSF